MKDFSHSGMEDGSEKMKCCERHLSKADLQGNQGNLFSVLFHTTIL